MHLMIFLHHAGFFESATMEMFTGSPILSPGVVYDMPIKNMFRTQSIA